MLRNRCADKKTFTAILFCFVISNILPNLHQTVDSFLIGFHGCTLSLRKPILRMFSTLGTPSAMLRSPIESPSRTMLLLSLSCLKYSVLRRAPSCLLYTWIRSPLNPLRMPYKANSQKDKRSALVFLCCDVKRLMNTKQRGIVSHERLTLSSKSMKLETTLTFGW